MSFSYKLTQIPLKLCVPQWRGVAEYRGTAAAYSNAATFAQSMWRKIQVFLPCGWKNESLLPTRPTSPPALLGDITDHCLGPATDSPQRRSHRWKQAEDYSQIITGWNEMWPFISLSCREAAAVALLYYIACSKLYVGYTYICNVQKMPRYWIVTFY